MIAVRELNAWFHFGEVFFSLAHIDYMSVTFKVLHVRSPFCLPACPPVRPPARPPASLSRGGQIRLRQEDGIWLTHWYTAHL